MAKSARGDPRKPAGEITFACARCKVDGRVYTFRAAPARIEDDPEAGHHPWRYFAGCQGCGAECEQAGWEKALFKAWANATGPRTPEGMAATAENLKGHPTAEEARRTRFNAMKHGLNARVATYFPAKPDGYAFCASCEVNREWCAEQPACVKRAENFMLHHAAFDQRKPELLAELHGDAHAAIFSLIQQILQSIMAEGVRLKSPVWYNDKDGRLHFVKVMREDGEEEQIYEINSHPLLKSLAELLKAANLSLSDMGMTVKVAESIDEDEMGRLRAAGGQAAPEAIESYLKRAQAQLEDLRGVVDRARARREEDPVLLEFNREAGTFEPPGERVVRAEREPARSISPNVENDPEGAV